MDASGAAYVTGQTYSSDFPTTPNAYDTIHNGDNNPFVTKIVDTVSSSVDDINSPTLPNDFNLGQNYPNPFNPQTQFEFSLPHAS